MILEEIISHLSRSPCSKSHTACIESLEKIAGLREKQKRKPYKLSQFDHEIDAGIEEKFTKALHKNRGNLTHTGEELGFTRQRAHEIAKRLNLVEMAAKLREANGQSKRGRPRI